MTFNTIDSGTGNAIILPNGYEIIDSSKLLHLRREVADLRSTLDNVTLDRDALVLERDELRAQVAELQAWKDAVPVLEIDIVATDGIVMREWPQKSATIAEWLDVVRCRHNYASDAERAIAMQRVLDGAR